MNLMPAGTRVKHSDETIMRAHDWFLSQGRSGPVRSGALADYEKKRAARGTIQEPDRTYLGHTSGYTVKWDDGTISHCLPYFVQKA